MLARVLVVEDQPDLRSLLSELLEAEGYSVRAAEHGAAALALIEQEAPDVVLLDLMMPVMDGRGFLEAAQQQPWRARLTVGVLSAAWQGEHLVDGYGVTYVAKPFDVEGLLATIAALIG